jgi:hypothetical protein
MSFYRVNLRLVLASIVILFPSLAGLRGFILPSDDFTWLAFSRNSFNGQTDFILVRYSTVDFVSKVMRSRSIIRENGCNIFVPNFFWLTSFSFCILSFSFTPSVSPSPLRSMLVLSQGLCLQRAFQVISRRHSAVSRVAVKQLTIRTDTIKQGQYQNTWCTHMCGYVRSLWESARANERIRSFWDLRSTPSRCWHVVHLFVVSLNDGVRGVIKFLYWYLCGGNKENTLIPLW